MRFGVYSPSSPAFTLKTRHVALGVTRCVFEGCMWFNTLHPSSAVQGGGPVSSSSERENAFCSKQAVTPGPPRPSGPYNLISSPRLQVTRSDAKRQRSTESWVTQGWLGQERPNRQPGDPPKLLSSAPRVLSLSPPGPPINPPLRPRAPRGGLWGAGNRRAPRTVPHVHFTNSVWRTNARSPPRTPVSPLGDVPIFTGDQGPQH